MKCLAHEVSHQHNHKYQIFDQFVQELRTSDNPRNVFAIDLLHRPFNSVYYDTLWFALV